MNAIDKDALTRAFETARKIPRERKRIDGWLADGDDWETVARSCVGICQVDALDLMPWQLHPLYYGVFPDERKRALREPLGDPSGAREAAEIVLRLLDAGLSMYEPDPIAALERAERAGRQPRGHIPANQPPAK